MPRYDFVDPYVASHWTQDAANSWDKVLESERMRRAEIEQKRRFDEQLGIQKGYLNVRTTESGQGARERGWVSPTEWKPEASATTFAQDRGHGQTLDTMKFGDQLKIGAEGRMRGYQAEDRGRIGGYFKDMGFGDAQAGALTEAFPQYQYLNPQELDPRMQAWERELINLRGEWARRTAAANNSGGGTENLFRILGGLNAIVDNDNLSAQRIRELDPPQRNLIQQVAGTTPENKRTPDQVKIDTDFKADSTTVMRGREAQLNFFQNRSNWAQGAAASLLGGVLPPQLRQPTVPADSINRAFTRPGATTDSTPPAAVAPATPAAPPARPQARVGPASLQGSPLANVQMPTAPSAEDRGTALVEQLLAAPRAAGPSRQAPAQGQTDPIAAKAYAAIKQGGDPVAVRARYKKLTGKELP